MRYVLQWSLCGFLLRFVVGLHPVPWMAWVVPALLLWTACRGHDARWRAGLLLACVIGQSANASYYATVASAATAVAITAGMALLWLLVIAETRRVVRRWPHAWTALAYPVFWVAADTLQAAWLPDGNWGSVAYSQAEVLPLMQTASLFGVPGVLFLLCLLPSAVVLLFLNGWRDRAGQVMAAATFLLLGAAITFGTLRLREVPAGTPLAVGLAAVDDAIGLAAQPPYINAIQAAYDEHVTALAAAGARVVVLPEKIAVATDAAASGWSERLAAAARRERVWLLAGIAVQTPAGIRNEAWLFSPDGRLDANYRKQMMAPPERGSYLPGDTCVVRDVDGTRAGIAICKDMHFASVGRAYGASDAGLMLVPAWDFVADGWLAARMTAVRGIENGYAVVRSAREGRLTVTDAYGRIVAEAPSAALPGARMNATLRAGSPVSTLYTRTGNVLGWVCVAIAAALAWRSRRGGTRP